MRDFEPHKHSLMRFDSKALFKGVLRFGEGSKDEEEMVPKKKNPNANPSSPVNGGGSGTKTIAAVTGEGFQRKSIEPVVDHWAFLEQIEAPMWVDLTLEVKSMNQDIDDAWFRTNHPFHQCASHHLMSTFAHSGEESASSNSVLLGPSSSSPKLPPSVSRSRGKHYRNRKIGVGDKQQLPIRILGSKTSGVEVSGYDKEIKPKSSFGNKKSVASSKASFVCESSSKGAIRPKSNATKAITSPRNLKSNRLCSEASFVGESNSTITSIGLSSSRPKSSSFVDLKSPYQEKAAEVNHQIFGETTGLLTAVRISLAKSCFKRRPSRVEIKPGRLAKVCKSSSSKSSVGSSRNPESDPKSTTFDKARTPESRNLTRMAQASKQNKGQPSKVSKTSSIDRVPSLTSNCRQESKIFASKSTQQEASTKSKVLYQKKMPTKALGLHAINVQNPLNVAIKAKERRVGTSRFSRVADNGKGNAIGGIVLGKKAASGKENAVGGIVQGQKALKKRVQVKDNTGLSDVKGKSNGTNNVVQRIYFR